jgi:hypothetical protein
LEMPKHSLQPINVGGASAAWNRWLFRREGR